MKTKKDRLWLVEVWHAEHLTQRCVLTTLKGVHQFTKVQLDANYKDGNEDGNYTLSFEDGRVIKRVYKDGECISGDC